MDLNISYNVPSSYRNFPTYQFMYIPSDFYTLAVYVQLPNYPEVLRPLFFLFAPADSWRGSSAPKGHFLLGDLLNVL